MTRIRNNTSLPDSKFELSAQKEWFDVIKIARAEMNSIVAERRLLTTIKIYIPPNADRSY